MKSVIAQTLAGLGIVTLFCLAIIMGNQIRAQRAAQAAAPKGVSERIFLAENRFAGNGTVSLFTIGGCQYVALRNRDEGGAAIVHHAGCPAHGGAARVERP